MQRNSIRKKIYNYNIVLIVILILVCSIYVFINDWTIKKFNASYTVYNELNQFYTNIKSTNDSFQVYVYSMTDANLMNYEEQITKTYKNLEAIDTSMQGKQDAWRFQLLRNMVDTYCKHAEEVKEASIVQDSKLNAQYQKLLYEYSLLNKTSSDYYPLVTNDMQQQKAAIDQNQRIMQVLSILFILYVILWFIYFSFTTIKSITNPIDRIIKNMKLIKKGEYDLTQISDANKEMMELCIALEDMANSIHENIQYASDKATLEKRVLEQQNDSLKKDELLAQSELRVLQNQINPHFLFNTLNMIYKKAYSEGALETVELMDRTSQLLRYGLDNENKFSNLKNEIKAIENYNFIQSKRYGDRIHFVIDVDDDIPNIKMPSMILQPLVENAVTHGLKDTIEDGEIVIEITRQSQDIVISISDNGSGMSPEGLEQLILNDYRMSEDDRSHLGLYNVTKRIKGLYGDDVCIITNSCEGCGFEIILRIALKEETIYV